MIDISGDGHESVENNINWFIEVSKLEIREDIKATTTIKIKIDPKKAVFTQENIPLIYNARLKNPNPARVPLTLSILYI